MQRINIVDFQKAFIVLLSYTILLGTFRHDMTFDMTFCSDFKAQVIDYKCICNGKQFKKKIRK